MKFIHERKSLLLFASCVTITGAMAQNMTSPYSIYGVGDIDFRPYNRTSGMGGTGLALKSSFYMIDNNPASITGLTRSFFIIDAAATGKAVQYHGDPVTAANSSNKDFWIKRLAIGIKFTDHWAGSIGVRQFSNINYSFSGTKPVEGSSLTYAAYFEGDGGLNEYSWTNALSIGKHLSLGLKASLISGTINQTETIVDASLQSTIATKVQDYFANGRFQTGAIYSAALGKKWGLSLGGKYIPKVNMVSARTLTVSQGSTTLVNDEFIKNDRFYLPETYAAGLALKHNNKTTYALDYTYEDWSKLNIKERGWRLVSSNRLSAGIELSRQATMWNQLMEKRFFQVGAFISNSYLRINNVPINEYGVTAGMGGVLGPGLIYTLALEGGRRGTTRQSLIRENYVQVTFSISYRDLLLSKGRKYD